MLFFCLKVLPAYSRLLLALPLPVVTVSLSFGSSIHKSRSVGLRGSNLEIKRGWLRVRLSVATSYKIFLVVIAFGIGIVVLPWLLLMMNLAVCVKLFKTCRLSRRVGRLLLVILRFQILGYGYDPGA